MLHPGARSGWWPTGTCPMNARCRSLPRGRRDRRRHGLSPIRAAGPIRAVPALTPRFLAPAAEGLPRPMPPFPSSPARPPSSPGLPTASASPSRGIPRRGRERHVRRHRRGPAGAEVGDEARGEGPIRMLSGDLREKLTIANLLSATVDAFDRVDILVNASRQWRSRTRSTPSRRGRDLAAAEPDVGAADVADDGQADDRAGRGRRPRTGEGSVGTIVNLSSIAAPAPSPSCWAIRSPARRWTR
jgi:hypothetical protein